MKEKFFSSGWLLVDKPEGVESFGVIRKLKFRFQFHKIGFAGTLDPLATGLLLIGINKATKKIPEIQEVNQTFNPINKQVVGSKTFNSGETETVAEAETETLETVSEAINGPTYVEVTTESESGIAQSAWVIAVTATVVT